ncbi:hypothetical protein AXG93_2818s1320 [Marchantia polymorpha subsp. ruderalis]|uniref:Uncharacterized protein n=1 Tax=Marchantia polymorpha subsp. ruderalis TaxID=1480154 RepID=A0A176VXB0_MARPO|nr:hypothetical protein AXG93_2818s1320 [Marchantia polymorpha subsp. ruderalis]
MLVFRTHMTAAAMAALQPSYYPVVPAVSLVNPNDFAVGSMNIGPVVNYDVIWDVILRLAHDIKDDTQSITRMLYETPQMYSPQIYVDGGHFESALLDTVPKLPTTSLLLNVLIPGGIVLTSF